jgi:anti-sigma B factor antagonist
MKLVTRIKCYGRLVSGPATGELKEAIKPLIAWGGRIIVDLGEVDYLDRSGLGTVVSLKVSAVKRGYCMLKFVEMTPRVLELLRVSNLAPMLSSGKS